MGHCGFHCLKVLVIVGNLVLMALGVAAIAIGIYTKVEIQNSDLDSSPGEAFNIAPIALILLGFFIVFLGSLGLWGGGKEDRFYISLYLLITALLVFAQFGTGVYCAVHFFNSNAANNTWGAQLENQWHSSALSLDDKSALEKAFNCCGWSNTADAPGIANCTVVLNTTDSCEEKVITFIKGNLIVITVVILSFMVLQIFWFVLTCCFCVVLKKHKRSEENEGLLGKSGVVYRS